MAPTVRWLALVLATLTIVVASPSCSSDKKGKSSKKQEGDTTGGDTGGKTSGKSGSKAGETTGTNPCLTLDDEKEYASDGDYEEGLALTAGEYSTIKDLIEEKCATCHPASGGPGDYKKPSVVAEEADEMLKRMKGDGNLMPPGTKPLPEADIKKFEDWIKAGKKIDGAGTTAGGETTGGTTSDPCGTGGTTGGETTGETTGGTTGGTMGTGTAGTAGTPDPEFFEETINPPARKACHAQDKPYYYKTGECEPYKYPAKFTCDKAGVLTAFNNNTAVKAELDAKIDGKSWSFDQCATNDAGKPVVYIVCFHSGDNKCVARDKLKDLPSATTLEIDVTRIGQ